MKYRKDCLTNEILNDLKQILNTLMVKWGCELIEFGGEEDHIHLRVDAHPNLNRSSLVKNLESVSSRRMRKQHADYLQKYLWGGEFWSDGSTIISVGSRDALEALIPYIKNQGKAALRDAN